MNESNYRRRVFSYLSSLMHGELDGERPGVFVESLIDETDADLVDSVLALTVLTRIDGRPGVHRFPFRWTEWEAYDDSSAPSMADGLRNLIRADIREELDTELPT